MPIRALSASNYLSAIESCYKFELFDHPSAALHTDALPIVRRSNSRRSHYPVSGQGLPCTWQWRTGIFAGASDYIDAILSKPGADTNLYGWPLTDSGQRPDQLSTLQPVKLDTNSSSVTVRFLPSTANYSDQREGNTISINELTRSRKD